MQERIENIAYFGIYNFNCNIEIIANILQINDYSGWSKGDQVPYRKGVISDSGVWEVRSTLKKEIALEEHLDWLICKLLPKSSKLQSIYDNYGATSELSIEICTYNVTNFGFHLDKDLLRKINKLGAVLDVDIFNL